MNLDISEYQNTIYHNPQRYDDQFWWKKNDMEFWKKIYNQLSNNKVLELGSGTGRLAIPLLKEGANYTGVEISEEFCQHSDKKIKQQNLTANFINKDFRNFELHKTYDMIFIGFNSFLHLLTDLDVMKFLNTVKKHMHSNTLFYIDIFVPNPSFLHREKKRERNLEYIDSLTNKITYIDEISKYDIITGIIKITWIYYSDSKKEDVRYYFTMKMYYPDTMNRLLIDAGFNINNLWGDYNQSIFNESSELQIYECNLPN